MEWQALEEEVFDYLLEEQHREALERKNNGILDPCIFQIPKNDEICNYVILTGCEPF